MLFSCRNEAILAETTRIKFENDSNGRTYMKFCPAMSFDVGMYKVVARNKVGQTVAYCRVVEGTIPDPPDAPEVTQISDTEMLLTWHLPKYDGHSPIICYSLEYKEEDAENWKMVAKNIDHEFYAIKCLEPQKSYMFRLASKNAMGWSEEGRPSNAITTKEAGVSKIKLTNTMQQLQRITDSGMEVTPEVMTKPNYAYESQQMEWISDADVQDHYKFISELHKGRFSGVVKGIDKRNDDVVVAKLLDTKINNEIAIEHEFKVLSTLRHERIAGLMAAYKKSDSLTAALVLEKLQGADIFTFLASKKEYTEQMVATIVMQVSP